ncbi:MAG: glycosyltransferase family 2 protein [Bacteroidota bacterium]
MDLSIVIPVFNEEQNIPELYQRLKAVVDDLEVSHEIIFIDDGSIDDSLDMIIQLSQKDSGVKYIELSRNFGQQIAVSAGLDFINGNRTVIIDADLQDPPELIKDLYLKMNDGLNVVYAKRRKRKGESYSKKITARMFYRILKRITSVEIPLDTGDFRIVDKKVVKALRSMKENTKFLRGQISWAGFKQGFVEYDRDERKGGRTGYSYGSMMRFAKDGITSFSDFPLKLVTYIGFLVAIIAFVVMIYALYSKYIMGSAVPGWTSIIISTLFLGGIQLLSIGVIGEYISRIAANVRNRPLYFVNRNNIIDTDKSGED